MLESLRISFFLELVADFFTSGALPYYCIADRLSGDSVPNNNGFPLIGDGN